MLHHNRPKGKGSMLNNDLERKTYRVWNDLYTPPSRKMNKMTLFARDQQINQTVYFKCSSSTRTSWGTVQNNDDTLFRSRDHYKTARL